MALLIMHYPSLLALCFDLALPECFYRSCVSLCGSLFFCEAHIHEDHEFPKPQGVSLLPGLWFRRAFVETQKVLLSLTLKSGSRPWQALYSDRPWTAAVYIEGGDQCEQYGQNSQMASLQGSGLANNMESFPEKV